MADVPATEGVRRTIAEYCHFVDGGRAGDWLDLFTDDAVMAVGQYGSLEGRGSLTRFINAIIEGVSAGPGINHLTMNEVIHVAGATATSVSYVLVVVPDGQGGFAVPLVGRYHDDFISTTATAGASPAAG